MKKGLIAIIVIIAAILGIWLYSSNSNSTSVQNTGASDNSSPSADNSASQSPADNSSAQAGKSANTGELFSASRSAKHAYLISTSLYDAKTKEALSGFTVSKKTLSDGSMEITLNAKKSGYQTQTYTVKPGEKLYFIETSMGDDENGRDELLGDDHAVLVDANGYIVSNQ